MKLSTFFFGFWETSASCKEVACKQRELFCWCSLFVRERFYVDICTFVDKNTCAFQEGCICTFSWLENSNAEF